MQDFFLGDFFSAQSSTLEHKYRFRPSSALQQHVDWQLCIRVTAKYIPSIISMKVACIFRFVVGADFYLLGLYYINTLRTGDADLRF